MALARIVSFDGVTTDLSAMPAGDTPGQRTGVARYDVAIRMST